MMILPAEEDRDIMANLEITPLNNAGTSLKKAGPADATLITPDNSALGTEFDSGDILTDNTFAAGEMLQIVVDTPVGGSGKVFFTIHAETD